MVFIEIKISRITLRKLTLEGKIPGMVKIKLVKEK